MPGGRTCSTPGGRSASGRPPRSTAWRSMAPDEPPERLPAVVGPGRVAVVHAEDAAVADHPMWYQRTDVAALLPGTEATAALLDLPFAGDLADGAVTSGGEVDDVPVDVRTLLPDAPDTWVQHDDLLVDGAPVDWWVEDSVVHAVHLAGLAAGRAGGRPVGPALRGRGPAHGSGPRCGDRPGRGRGGSPGGATVRSVRKRITSRRCTRSPPSRTAAQVGERCGRRRLGGTGSARHPWRWCARWPWSRSRSHSPRPPSSLTSPTPLAGGSARRWPCLPSGGRAPAAESAAPTTDTPATEAPVTGTPTSDTPAAAAPVVPAPLPNPPPPRSPPQAVTR